MELRVSNWLIDRWATGLAGLAHWAKAIRQSVLASAVIVATLMADCWLLGLDMAFRYAVLDGTELPNWFNLSQEMGLGEIFEHVMTALGICALLMLFYRHRRRQIAMATILLALVLADNALQLHEQVGVVLGGALPTDLLLPPHQIGELLFLSAFALVALATLAPLFHKDIVPVEQAMLLIVALIGFAAIFGIAVDAVHAMLATGSLQEVVAGSLEDFGELVGISLAGAFAVAVAAADPIPATNR